MKNVDYTAVAEDVMAKISKGAFLTVKADGQLNTMTIGWAMLGNVWFKPVMMVAVRDTRHTFGIIEKAADFTVSVPEDKMTKEIGFCGTKSGRDYDKFKECGLTEAPAQNTVSPIINVPGIHFECRIIYKSAMDPAFLDAACNGKIYPQKDYHTLYFGEIVGCYQI